MKAQFTFLSGARAGQIEAFRKGYIGLGRHPLSDIRFDAERDLDVSSSHAAIVRKPEGFVLQDLGSRNGTFVNGQRITADTLLHAGDVIALGEGGPSVEFQIIEAPTTSRRSTGMRIASEVSRQTAQLRRTTKTLIALFVLVVVGFVWMQWDAGRRARELEGVRDALRASQDETARLRRALEVSTGDASSISLLRAQLDAAERRQRAIAGVDYRAISQKNQDAVAIVLVELTDGERFSGTAFSVDSLGTMITNRHLLVGEDGTKTPKRIGVIFSGSTQFWRGEMIGVSADADIGVFRVTIKGGTPRVAGLLPSREGLERGDPVAILGYPLGFDLPMEAQGGQPIAEPTLTVGAVSKALTSVVQVDAYGAPGSSGSPVFDREGKVIAVLYGGERDSQGKIIFAVPAYIAAEYLRSLGLLR
ncbi:MAG TPA: trypsin-like peptidase domain-containing protein [Gemmatimonadales bacterium]|nr:trypsin-like peptidase domain-containing protein [Gemmatimonadales bacterium]